jgi:surface antigen
MPHFYNGTTLHAGTMWLRSGTTLLAEGTLTLGTAQLTSLTATNLTFTTAVGSHLNLSGPLYGGDCTFGGSGHVEGAMSVAGTATLGDVLVGGSGSFLADVHVDGSATLSTLTCTSASTFSGVMSVYNSAYIYGSVLMCSTLNVSNAFMTHASTNLGQGGWATYVLGSAYFGTQGHPTNFTDQTTFTSASTTTINGNLTMATASLVGTLRADAVSNYSASTMLTLNSYPIFNGGIGYSWWGGSTTVWNTAALTGLVYNYLNFGTTGLTTYRDTSVAANMNGVSGITIRKSGYYLLGGRMTTRYNPMILAMQPSTIVAIGTNPLAVAASPAALPGAVVVGGQQIVALSTGDFVRPGYFILTGTAAITNGGIGTWSSAGAGFVFDANNFWVIWLSP